MKKSTITILDNLVEKHNGLKDCYNSIYSAVKMLKDCYVNSNKILACGNGGSAADAEHIVGELMKGFLLSRKLDSLTQRNLKEMFPQSAGYLNDNLQMALPAISLVSQTALMTAFANDQAADLIFAQQVFGYGNEGDILIAISTSGNSKNIMYAAQIAKFKGMKVISLTGRSGGQLAALSDILINVSAEDVFVVQEYHLPVYHALCACVENEFFSEGDM